MDWNGDNKLDLATSNAIGRNISLLFGDGTGGFSSALSVPLSGAKNVLSMVTGDFNGDQRPDFAVTVFLGISSPMITLRLLLNNGVGGFTAKDFSFGQKGFAVGDINGDKISDLLINQDSSGVLVIMGDRMEIFSETFTFLPAGVVNQMVLGDINGDQRPDFIGASTSGVVTLLGKSSGRFLDGAPIGTGGLTSAVGDFNGDGLPDFVSIVATSQQNNDWAVSLSDGAGGYFATTRGTYRGGSPYNSTGGPYAMATADFNHDGRLDVVVIDTLDVSVFLGDGTGNLGNQSSLGLPSISSYRVIIADYDGDQNLDLVVADLRGRSTWLYRGDGTGIFPERREIWRTSIPPLAVAAGDVDGDNKLDLIISEPGVIVIESTRAMNMLTLPVSSDVSAILVGDLDGDQRADLAFADQAGTLSVRLGDGMGGFAVAATFPVGPGASCIAMGDADGDHQPDLFVTRQYPNVVSVLLNQGKGVFLPAQGYAVATSLCAITEQLNADLKIDLVAVNGGLFTSQAAER